MNNKSKKTSLIIVLCVLTVIGTLVGIFYPDEPINNTIGEYQNIIRNEIVELDENIVIEDITENEEISSKAEEVEEVTLEDEINLEEELQTENESFELEDEESISYDGDRAKSWNIETGEYKGLTYYSQIDNRWKNILYTSTGNTSQTIGSSGCGPTSAAMVVSSIKGEITPDILANTFVKYGYRSANNGTYWSAYRAVADEFNIGYTETSDIQKAIKLLESKNYVIVSCGNGLFTTGGHYIVIVGIEGNAFKIYDPYLYNGKFDTSSRRGKVQVSGNTVYCSIDNFINYSNYKGFFCYQDIEHNVSRFKAGDKVVVNIPVGIACYQGNYALVDDLKGTATSQFWIHKSVITEDNRVYGLADVCYDGGIRDIVQIFDSQFWCNETNMNEYIYVKDIQAIQTNKIKNTVGEIKQLKQASIIYEKNNLTGKQYNYKINTRVKILKNVNSNVDYIQVVQTGRKGYIKNNLYK